MRYWTPLAAIALCSCGVSFTHTDMVEVVGTQTESEKLQIAKNISSSLLDGELAQELKDTIPELNNQTIGGLLKVGWFNSNNDGVFVKCTFNSSLPSKVAQEAVDICASHASAKLASLAKVAAAPDRQATNHTVNFKSKARSTKAIGSSKSVPEESNLSAIEFLTLRDHLSARNFKQLNQLLETYQSEYDNNTTSEFRLTDAYRAFALSDDQYQQIFVDWINATPNSYQPYLAAANYHVQRGWSARGSSVMNKVSADNKVRFNEELQHAASLSQRALELNPNSMPAYLTLLTIEKSINGYQESSPVSAVAFELFPDSLELRIIELNKRQPRWGGNYDLMHQFVEKQIALYPDTEKFKLLRGLIDIEKSRALYVDNRYEEAYAIATGATAQGKLANYYYRRSKTGMAMGLFSESLEDINTAIALRPTDYEHYLQKGHVLAKMDKIGDALDSYNLAVQLTPTTAEKIAKRKSYGAKVQRNKATKVYASDLAQAIAHYDNALLIDENYHDAVYWRANALVKLGQHAQAGEGFKRSMAIDPTHFDSHREYDYILARDFRWDEIIAMWDTFLTLEPKHADAYLERAGAHHHKGNQQQSYSDLKSACELDSKQACAIVASFERQ